MKKILFILGLLSTLMCLETKAQIEDDYMDFGDINWDMYPEGSYYVNDDGSLSYCPSCSSGGYDAYGENNQSGGDSSTDDTDTPNEDPNFDRPIENDYTTGDNNNNNERRDCAGVKGGKAYIDNCRTCVGGTTGKIPCEPDCAGVYNGIAYIDDCNECVGGTTLKSPCEKDCAGVKDGSAYLDQCEQCVEGTTGREPCNPCEVMLKSSGAAAGLPCNPCGEKATALAIRDAENCWGILTEGDIGYELSLVMEEDCNRNIDYFYDLYLSVYNNERNKNIGKPLTQKEDEGRCYPLSIQYLGCASQEDVMQHYMQEYQNTIVNPCYYTNGKKDFPGVEGKNILSLMNDFLSYSEPSSSTWTNGSTITNETGVQSLNQLLDAETTYLVITEQVIIEGILAEGHAFVITGKGTGTSIIGYDPNSGYSKSLPLSLFTNKKIYLYEYSGCK